MSQFQGAKQPIPVTVDNQAAFIDMSGSAPRCISGICTHQGCPVAWDNAQQEFICPCHNSAFALSGKVLHGPATKPLRILPATIVGDDLHVQA